MSNVDLLFDSSGLLEHVRKNPDESKPSPYPPMFAPVVISKVDNGFIVRVDVQDGDLLMFNTLGDRYGTRYDEGGKPIASVIDWLVAYFERTV